MALVNELDEDERDDEAPGDSPGAAAPTRLSFSMAARNAFFQRVTSGVRKGLPERAGALQIKGGFDLIKLWFDNERVHYEVAIDLYREHIEVGLHFEDGPVSTAIYLRELDARVVEIKHELGPEVELERWTQSWGRIYELRALTVLDAAAGEWAAQRTIAFMAELQPIVEEIYAPRERSAQPKSTEKYRWGGRSRRARA